MELDTSVDELTFVAFDFETTGLYPRNDEIVEIGAVRFRGGEVLAEYSELVNPGREIPLEAQRISGIDDAMVAGKPLLSALLPGFLEFLGDSVLMAHNAGFDLGFLRAAIEKSGGGSLNNLVIDTQQLAKKAFPGQKSYSLQSLAGVLKFPPNQAHRALDDSVMCMRLFLAACDSMSFMGSISLAEVMA